MPPGVTSCGNAYLLLFARPSCLGTTFGFLGNYLLTHSHGNVRAQPSAAAGLGQITEARCSVHCPDSSVQGLNGLNGLKPGGYAEGRGGGYRCRSTVTGLIRLAWRLLQILIQASPLPSAQAGCAKDVLIHSRVPHFV